MCPEVLVLLLLVVVDTESSDDSTGLNFVVVFPENIAYYFPEGPENRVHITALHSDTVVSVQSYTYSKKSETLMAGETQDFKLDQRLELKNVKLSDKTTRITSTKRIMVQAVSLKSNSVQTALVLPTDQLGTEYLVPPSPIIQGINATTATRGPFRVIVVNSGENNTVTLEGMEFKQVLLGPFQSAQVNVKAEAALRVVRAEQPVTVLFGHACAIVYNCTCVMLHTPLLPAQQVNRKFFIPPAFVKSVEDATFVLLSDRKSSKVEAFSPSTPLVETTGTAILYRPGLLLALIPESDFAACYVINFIPNLQNFVVIVINKGLTDGVHIGSAPPENPQWQQLTGTDYVSAVVALAEGENVIWHVSSKMAVYFMGRKDQTLFGNPAASISKISDYRGCVLSPEVVEIGDVAGSWRESVKYCRDKDLELVSLPSTQLQSQIYEKVMEANRGQLQEVWIGMRRSYRTGDWYWLSKASVTDVNWEHGEPGSVNDGQCVAMNLESRKDFGWRDEDCCKALHPICYRSPILFPK